MYISTSPQTQVLQLTAQSAIDQINNLLQTGQISTEADLLVSIEKAWNSVSGNNLKSTIVIPNYMLGNLPMRDDLEIPLYEAENDINNLWNYYSQILSSLAGMLNNQQAQSNAVSSLIGVVQNKTSNFQLSSSDTSSNFLWASDSFMSLEHVDTTNTTAYVDTNSGYVSLSVNSLTDLVPSISSFSIDRVNSVGIPGNNLEIASVQYATSPDAANQEPQATLVDPNGSLATIANMFSTSSTNWFEWEYNYVPRIQTCKSIQTAWAYDPSGQQIDIEKATLDDTGQPAGWKKFIQWPGDTTFDDGPDGTGYWIGNFDLNTTAKLIFTLTFNTPQKLSTIEITPQILGGIYPIVRKVAISNNGYTEVLATDVYLTNKLNEALTGTLVGLPETSYAGIGVWTVSDEEVSSINISLEAGGSYVPTYGFGHHYYFEVIDKRTDTTVLFVSFVDKSATTDRLPNQTDTIQTGSSGGNLSAVGELIGAAVGGVVGGLIGSAAGSLFSQTTSTSIARQGDAYDIFTGSRSAIGIKNIGISIRDYATQSIFVSTPWYFAQPLSAVSIITTENIPTDFSNNTTFITYEISTDGSNWLGITPQNYAASPNSTIEVNGAQNITVRATIVGGSNVNESPRLISYALKGLVQA